VADLNLNANFCVCPEVLDEATWLAKHGKVVDLKPDAAPTFTREPSDEPDPSKPN
jgi:hypothetical protein